MQEQEKVATTIFNNYGKRNGFQNLQLHLTVTLETEGGKWLLWVCRVCKRQPHLNVHLERTRVSKIIPGCKDFSRLQLR